MKRVYLNTRFYICFIAIAMLFVMSFGIESLFIIAQILVLILILLIIVDYRILKKRETQITVKRKLDQKLSLGDLQDIEYNIHNSNKAEIAYTLYDELPEQFQFRDPIANGILEEESERSVYFNFRPITRGVYKFDRCHLILRNKYLGLISLRSTFDLREETYVYPSIIQMKRYELQVFSRLATLVGVRKTRRIGENDEFEHIRPYLQGDNIRSINWKATSRRASLMVNQFQNTRSQKVYCIIDKGRSMKMPFNELSLLDYSINSSLVLSNIILKKYDKAGLITFSEEVNSFLKASSRKNQLEHILHQLYSQRTGFNEANFDALYKSIQLNLRNRSLIFLFTNFEHEIDFQRNLKILKAINKRHLLVVIQFINTEVLNLAEEECHTLSDIYTKTFAQKSISDKKKLSQRLRSHGIMSIMTKPENLSINVINSYLEIKNKRMI